MSSPPVVSLPLGSAVPPSSPPPFSYYAEEVRHIEARADTVRECVGRSTDGALHPHYTSSGLRIPVSTSEKRWLFDYFNAVGADVLSGNYYSDCRTCILGDTAARLLFHPRHISNSDRVKTMAKPIIECVKNLQNVGYPIWYIDGNCSVML